MKKIIVLLTLLTSMVFAEVANRENVTRLYVGYFNRTPDTEGLNYWVNDSGLSLEGIAQSFYDQPETNDKYPPSTTNGEFITAIYNNLFDRDPDVAGFDYWKAALDANTLTRTVFILAIINGAQGDDKAILDNKTEVGLYFTENAQIDLYIEKKVMEIVTQDPETVLNGMSLIDNYVAAKVYLLDVGIEDKNVSDSFLQSVTFGEDSVAQVKTAIDDYLQDLLDKKKPVVVLIGDANVSMYTQESYGEKGATATDHNNSAIAVVVTGNVNTDEAGEYIITYTATDSEGNTNSIKRTVTVLERPNTKPLANAGQDIAVVVDTAIVLSGTGSDEDGSIVSHVWTENGEILAETSSFEYSSDVIGVHALRLTVTDDDNVSAYDEVSVTVNEAPNVAPIANAGIDKSVVEGVSVAITGSASDSDGNVVSYEWKEGASVLADAASFHYVGTSVGVHTLTLTATDDDGATHSDTVIVAVAELPNVAPIANAGIDKSVVKSGSVAITGSASDSDGSVVSYKWKEGSTVLADTASFEYMSASIGTHTLTLTVTDDDGATHSDTVIVTVTPIPNIPPVADAGKDQTLVVGKTVTITGTGSDADGNIVSYKWEEGNTLLRNSRYLTKSFSKTGTYTYTFTVTDNKGAAHSDTVTFTIIEEGANIPPVANANDGKDIVMMLGDRVDINGSGSDADGTIASYSWSEGTKVLGTSGTLSYTAATVGVHTLVLTVTDNDGAKVSDNIKVTVNDYPNVLPTADAGEDRTIGENTASTITGVASDSDGVIVSYRWSENNVTLSDMAGFEYESSVIGEHTLTFEATDDDGATVSDTVVVTVNDLPNVAPVANAGSDVTIYQGDATTLQSKSTDSDGSIASYLWTENGETLADTVSFDYTGLELGDHTLTLTIMDNEGLSSTDIVVVRAVEVPNKLPSVNAGSDKTVYVGNTLTVTGSGTDSDGTVVSYQWKKDGTVVSNTADLNYTPSGTGLYNVGKYTFTLTVTDDDGEKSSDSMTVTVIDSNGNKLPTANAGVDKSVNYDQSVTITGSGTDSDGTLVSYQWKDGSTVLANTASFSYVGTTSGTRTLTLTVTDDYGSKASDTMIVTVIPPNQIPTANAGVDKSVEESGSIVVTGTASDSDGTIASYEWKEGSSVLATTASFSYIGTSIGVHTLTFKVTDDDGATKSDTMIVTVTEIPNVAPTANAGSDKNVETGSSVTVLGSATDGDGSIVSYEWKEGTTVLATTASFSYAGGSVGVHTLTLTVTDNDGATDSDTMTVTVAALNQAPTADAGVDKSVEESGSIVVTGTASDSDGTIASYEWKEGSSVLATTASFSYIGTSIGVHTLTFKVTDDDGATKSDTMIVTVTEIPNVAPTANAGSDKNVETGSSVTVLGSATDGDGSIVSYEWKEGTTVLATTASFSYAGGSVGVHTLTLTVTDNDGATDSDTMTVTVAALNQAPTANAGVDKSVDESKSVTIFGTAGDSDGTLASYEWKEGTEVLADTASFDYVGTVVGKHTLTFTVTDDDGATKSDTMIVTVLEPVVVSRAIPGSSRTTEFLNAINQARSQPQDCGVYGIKPATTPLTWSTPLYNAAYEHAQDMGRAENNSHTGSGTVHDWTAVDLGLSGGSSLAQRLTANGYQASSGAGENIAWGYGGSLSAIVSAWIGSDSHCANLMNPSWKTLGMAMFYLSDSASKYYTVQEFGVK